VASRVHDVSRSDVDDLLVKVLINTRADEQNPHTARSNGFGEYFHWSENSVTTGPADA